VLGDGEMQAKMTHDESLQLLANGVDQRCVRPEVGHLWRWCGDMPVGAPRVPSRHRRRIHA